MDTEQLIRALTADKAERPSLERRLLVALAGGFVVAAALFLWMLGPRSDFVAATRDPLFVLKFAVTLALAMAAAGLVLRLVRPGTSHGFWRMAMLAAPVLLVLGILYEVVSLPAAALPARLVGRNSWLCLTSIPLLAAPILAALLFSLRNGAPTRPALAGALAGLTAGGLGAALYAAHCTDDSPLFVMTWYGIAIVLVMAVGAAVGERVLRW